MPRHLSVPTPPYRWDPQSRSLPAGSRPRTSRPAWHGGHRWTRWWPWRDPQQHQPHIQPETYNKKPLRLKLLHQIRKQQKLFSTRPPLKMGVEWGRTISSKSNFSKYLCLVVGSRGEERKNYNKAHASSSLVKHLVKRIGVQVRVNLIWTSVKNFPAIRDANKIFELLIFDHQQHTLHIVFRSWSPQDAFENHTMRPWSIARRQWSARRLAFLWCLSGCQKKLLIVDGHVWLMGKKSDTNDNP